MRILSQAPHGLDPIPSGSKNMNNIVYLVGAVVIILAILSFIGLR
ncbi:MAG: hypothetical protein ACK515_14900 [bacterium]|jgi:hypothetical protein